MGLTSRTILDIIELAYYGPVLLLSLLVIRKHGMGRQLGWIYLVILAIIRIVGASTGIAANKDPSIGLEITSTICYGIGLSPLLLAWLGLIKRVNEGMDKHAVNARRIQLIHIPVIVGLIMGIIGGTKLYDSNPNTRTAGQHYSQAAVILFLAGYLLLVLTTVMTAVHGRHVMDGEKRLLFAGLLAIPFLAVRIVYSIIVAFDHTSRIFSLISDSNTAVIVQACMSLAMEFIVVAIFIAVGFMTPAIARSAVQRGSSVGQTYQVNNNQFQSGPYKQGQQHGVTSVNY